MTGQRGAKRTGRVWLLLAAGVGLIAAGLVGSAAAAQRGRQSADAGVPGAERIELAHGGLTREAWLWTPAGPAPQGGWPVVVMLHGGGGGAASVAGSSGWTDLGAREGFAVLFPQGTAAGREGRAGRRAGRGGTWNDGRPIDRDGPRGMAGARGVDDVGFLVALVDAVGSRGEIDGQRVYVSGHSNGAGMAMRVASSSPGRFAAVGVVAGHLWAQPGALQPAVPLMHVVGDADPLSPPGGGEVGLGRTRWEAPPASRSVAWWAQALGVAGAGREESGGAVTQTVWGEAGTAREVRLVVVHGHGHTWPGSPQRMPARLVGPVSESGWGATEALWAFFEGRRRGA